MKLQAIKVDHVKIWFVADERGIDVFNKDYTAKAAAVRAIRQYHQETAQTEAGRQQYAYGCDYACGVYD